MSVKQAPSAGPKTLGLALSGGGFRASFFALGVLRYLAEARLLQSLRVVSAVSGGSIIAAMLADRWPDFENAGASPEAFLQRVDEPFRSCVTERNLRWGWLGRSVLRVPLGAGGRGSALAATLDRHLYRTKELRDLRSGPLVIFTATDLATGAPFRMSRDFVGSGAYGYMTPPPTLRLSSAVAASAAFPAAMAVVRLRSSELSFVSPTTPWSTISLVDGGVYDNTGLEWFLSPQFRGPQNAEQLKCDFVIAVNASGGFYPKGGRYGALRILLRSSNIQYVQTIYPRIRGMVQQLLEARQNGVYIAIGNDPRKVFPEVGPSVSHALLPSDVIPLLRSLRTDLDRFSPIEARLLSYHGYWLTHSAILRWAPQIAVDEPEWVIPEWAAMSAATKTKIISTLNLGAHRFRQVRRPLHSRYLTRFGPDP